MTSWENVLIIRSFCEAVTEHEIICHCFVTVNKPAGGGKNEQVHRCIDLLGLRLSLV